MTLRRQAPLGPLALVGWGRRAWQPRGWDGWWPGDAATPAGFRLTARPGVRFGAPESAERHRNQGRPAHRDPHAAMAAFPVPGQQIGASPPLTTPRLDSADLPYQRLRLLVSAPRSKRAIAIGSRPMPAALGALERLGLAGQAPTAALDRQLLQAGRDAADQGANLCLRCRVSQAAEQKLLALVGRFGRSHQLDLIDLDRKSTRLNSSHSSVSRMPSSA